MMRSAWENDEIVEQFRDWLSHTSREISDLDDLDEVGDESVETDDEQSVADWPTTGLLQVVEALTAMRHELKLQTRNGRSLEDSVQGARQSLEAAMRQFQSVQAKEAESAQRAALPLIEALAGLDESLLRGVRAMEITHRQLTEMAPQQLRQVLDDELQRLPWWRRWLIRAWCLRLRDRIADAAARFADEEFARIMEGYQLIQSRVQQELRKQGLSRLVTLGQRVDPTCMTVVDIVDDPSLPPEMVVEELRPGYRWREIVIRCAEVRAVKSRGNAGINTRDAAAAATSDFAHDAPTSYATEVEPDRHVAWPDADQK
jgi:hypothetical protein